MARVEESEVLRQKRGVLRFQIGQAYQRIYGLDDPPPCSAACVSDWWMLRLREHWASAFWELGRLPVMLYQVSELAPELEVVARNVERGHAPGPTRRAVHGAWKLLETGEKGRQDAQAMRRREATELYRFARLWWKKEPAITRRQLLRVLMLEVGGKDALVVNGRPRQARDPVYRAAYDKARSKLAFGFRLDGCPKDFRHLA
jgi:hypothetical protein